MSNPYSPNVLPDLVSVRCPDCEARAWFEFASYVPIRERQYIAYFKKSDHFDYVNNPGHGGGTVHIAVYFHGLHGNTLHTIDDLPDTFETTAWEKIRAGTTDRMYRYFDHGVVTCTRCNLRRKHQLHWPDDAWFQLSYRRQTLWAYDRASAAELRAFVEAEDRSLRRFTHRKFLLKIPAHFLDAKARTSVAKRLGALLND